MVLRTFFLVITLLIFVFFKYVIIAINNLGCLFFVISNSTRIFIIIITDIHSVAGRASISLSTDDIRFPFVADGTKIDKIRINTTSHRLNVWWSTSDLISVGVHKYFSASGTCPTNNCFWKSLADSFSIDWYSLVSNYLSSFFTTHLLLCYILLQALRRLFLIEVAIFFKIKHL